MPRIANPQPMSKPAERILAMAALAFADDGFAGASMTRLAERCGVSKALLYHYYASKDEILFRMLDAYTRRLIALCESVTARRLAPQEHFDALIRTLLIEYRTSRAVHKVILQDVDHLPLARRKRIRAQQRDVVEHFRAAIAGAFLTKADELTRTAVAMMVLGMINWTFTWLDPDGALSYEDFASAVLAVCRGGLTELSGPRRRALGGTTKRRASAGEQPVSARPSDPEPSVAQRAGGRFAERRPPPARSGRNESQ